MEYTIRKYEQRDRKVVRWICCETGFMGDPMEVYFEGREIFADTWTRYWTDYEPESSFVAEADGKVVGYILGCLDTERQERILKEKIQPSLYKQAFSSTFFLHLKNWRYMRRVVRSWRRGEFNDDMKAVIADYPAHLHTNIAPAEFRGQGMGKALMNAYFDYLRANKAKGVHLVTTSRNKIALGLYFHMGFKKLFSGPLTCYDHVTSEPLEKICLAMKLG
jgi:GNAT superfamily N-acetyltransferase